MVNYVYPTKDNPFMNIQLDDYENNINRESVIKEKIQFDEELAKNIDKNFDNKLYKNFDDIYDRNNSKRQFYTTAITKIPNNQKKFANWLYNTNKTCKEGNGFQCNMNLYERIAK